MSESSGPKSPSAGTVLRSRDRRSARPPPRAAETSGSEPPGRGRSPAALEERRQDGDLVMGVPAEPAGETDRRRSGAAPTCPLLRPDTALRARRAHGRCPSRPSPPRDTQASSREGKKSVHSSLYPPARGWRLTGGGGRSASSGDRGGRGGERAHPLHQGPQAAASAKTERREGFPAGAAGKPLPGQRTGRGAVPGLGRSTSRGATKARCHGY